MIGIANNFRFLLVELEIIVNGNWVIVWTYVKIDHENLHRNTFSQKPLNRVYDP